MRRLATLLLALAATAYKDPDGFVVAGYLPEWRYEGAHWESLAKHLTHLIFFSAEPKPDGTITGLDRLPRPELLKEARKAADENDLKLLVCFGGNGRSSGFAAMTGSDKSRKKFVENLAKLLEKKKLDGVDYNWEYPGHSFQTGYSEARISREWRGLKLLLEETRRALPEAVISVAYYPDGRQENLLAAASENANVDHFAVARYAFEILPVGSVIPTATFDSVPLLADVRIFMGDHPKARNVAQVSVSRTCFAARRARRFVVGNIAAIALARLGALFRLSAYLERAEAALGYAEVGHGRLRKAKRGHLS